MVNRTGWLVVCVCLLSSPLPLSARRSSSGGGSFSSGGGSGGMSGGFNRGSSASRGQQGPGGGFQQPGSGGFPSQNRGGFNNNNNNNGFHGQHAGGVNTGGGFRGGNTFNQPRGFSSGNGVGSVSRASNFKYALLGAAAGAAGGILLYEGTKAIIQHASNPFQWNNKPYYWGQEHYKGNSNEQMCSVPFESLQKPTVTETTTTAPTTTVAPSTDNSTIATTVAPVPDADNKFNNIQFADGTRPKQVVWGCKKGLEICCGLECCPAPPPPQTQSTHGSGNNIGQIIMGIIFVLLLASCCCCCLVYLMCRSALDCILPRNDPNTPNQRNYEEDKYDDYPHDRQQYPMQQYHQGDGGYPQQQQQYPQGGGGYPQHGGYPQQGGGYPGQQQYGNTHGYPNQYPPNPSY